MRTPQNNKEEGARAKKLVTCDIDMRNTEFIRKRSKFKVRLSVRKAPIVTDLPLSHRRL